MRKYLLAGVAMLPAAGTAMAQAPAGAPTQGQVAYPLVNPTAYVNDNNNYQAPALKGALANPTPGTIVVHINGRVMVQMQATWTSADSRFVTDPTPGSQAAIFGANGTGVVKLAPLAINSYARL